MPQSGNRTRGVWSSVVDWPLISIHAAILPDGRVMTYGTNVNSRGTAEFMYDIFDPAEQFGTPASHLTLPNTTGTYIFCSAQVLLPLTGELMLTGGDLLVNGKATEYGNTDVNIFNPVNNQLQPASDKMKLPRWYGTSIVLPSGEIYLQGGSGGEAHPEIRGNDGKFTLLSGIDTLKTTDNGSRYFDNNYPRNFVARNGKVFGIDPHWMYEVDPYGTGANGNRGKVTMFQNQWDIPNTRGEAESYRGWAATSSAVMYAPGKILQLGGTKPNVTIIDINGPTPRLTDLAPLSRRRQWADATLMADGNVFLSGGSSENLLNDTASQNVGDIWYDTETFDPKSESWTQTAPLAVPRLYHGTTLLLTDGTILSSGGGSPGPVTNLNAQIYYPGYLFRSDGTRAARPVIDQVGGALPDVFNPGQTFNLSSPDSARIERVTMVKTGAVTHAFNMDQRFVEPAFTIDANQVRVTLPANPYDTPPGYYMVFIFDDQGTPSKAKMIRINPAS